MSTPPNQPYGQPQYGQPPYGQPQYGQPSYGYPPNGQPQNGQPGYGYPPPPGPVITPQAERKGRRLWWGFVAAVVALGGLAAWDGLRSPKLAGVGACMTNAYTPKRVDCTSPDATLVVLKRYDNPVLTTGCGNVPGTTRTYRGKYRKHFRTKKYIVCLGAHTPGGKSAVSGSF